MKAKHLENMPKLLVCDLLSTNNGGNNVCAYKWPEDLEKRWKALHSQLRQYLISFFQGVDILVNLFEEQDHEKAAGTFTLALNLKGIQEPSFGMCIRN